MASYFDDYAAAQRRPTKHMVGIGVVVLMHLVLGWALVNGLARKVVEVIKGPIETKIIEETKPPPPPPENLPPPPAPVAAQPAIGNVSACKPEYPPAAQRAEISGVSTTIRFTVDATGKLANAEVIKSAGASREHKLMDRAALSALSGCTFRAGRDTEGRAVGASFNVEYVWKLE